MVRFVAVLLCFFIFDYPHHLYSDAPEISQSTRVPEQVLPIDITHFPFLLVPIAHFYAVFILFLAVDGPQRVAAALPLIARGATRILLINPATIGATTAIAIIFSGEVASDDVIIQELIEFCEHNPTTLPCDTAPPPQTENE